VGWSKRHYDARANVEDFLDVAFENAPRTILPHHSEDLRAVLAVPLPVLDGAPLRVPREVRLDRLEITAR